MSQFATYPSLQDRVVFISGGATGIGETLVEHFCAQGSKVAFVDIKAAEGRALADRIAAAGDPKPLFIDCDLKDIPALQAAIRRVGDELGPIGALVNNAANDQRHRLEDVTVAIWDDRMAVNLRHYFFAAQAVAEQMKAIGGGSIVNVGSFSWKRGEGEMPGYVTAKAAIHGLTRTLARDLGEHRIRVNTMIPGWVMTRRQVDLWVDAEGEAKIARNQCLKDKVMPADVARMVLFLAADDSRMCCSQEYLVEGGWV